MYGLEVAKVLAMLLEGNIGQPRRSLGTWKFLVIERVWYPTERLGSLTGGGELKLSEPIEAKT